MSMDGRKWRDGNFMIGIVLALSAIYLTIVAISIHDGIFYAGDQGIKALEVKQLCQGFGFKYLHLPQPEWVQSIWNAGFTPLRTPTFYKSPNGYLFVFPPAFQIVSSWLYTRWGIAGLYVIPMLSTIALLSWLIILLKRVRVKPILIALAVFLLVFCSPLALYGVMFWEHLPAVLLLFSGVAFLVNPPPNKWAAGALGCITGLAIFLRPEALMMNFLYATGAIAIYFWNRRNGRDVISYQTNPVTFLAGMAIPAAAFFCFNWLEYGSFLGLHARQIFVDNDPDSRMGLKHGFQNFWKINYISARHFLLVLWLIPLLIHAIALRKTTDPRPGVLAAVVILFSLMTPWVLPNDGIVQWGARYFLAIIPITLVALFLAERQWKLLNRRYLPKWALCLVVLATGYSFYHNTHGGGWKEVRWRYSQRLTKEYRLIDSRPGSVVVLARPWMVNDFAYLFDKDYFFAASNNDSLQHLLPLLRKNGVHRYIYIYNPQQFNLPTMLRDSTTRHWLADSARKVFVKEDVAAKVCTIN